MAEKRNARVLKYSIEDVERQESGRDMRTSSAHLRIARPTLDLARIQHFYVDGLGMSVLYEGQAPANDGRQWELLMCGFDNAAWHLEFTRCEPDPITPAPTVEDLLVFYLGDPASVEQEVPVLENHGGTIVGSENPYWDSGGITIRDPDGYRLVLTARTWR